VKEQIKHEGRFLSSEIGNGEPDAPMKNLENFNENYAF